MTKAALNSMTEALAHELRPSGVRVNAICPGLIGASAMADELIAAVKARKVDLPIEDLLTRQGRPGTPPEVAELIAFLASDGAAFINGVAYALDGGLTASFA